MEEMDIPEIPKVIDFGFSARDFDSHLLNSEPIPVAELPTMDQLPETLKTPTKMLKVMD